MTHFPLARRRGSALVTTLLVIAVLTIIVIAFLQSMTTEHQTSSSYLNRYRAETAADAGANSAIQLVKGLIEAHPDSATTWDVNVSSDASHQTPATSLVYFDPSPIPQNGAPPATPQLGYQPLVSGFDPKTFTPGTTRPAAALSANNVQSTGGTQEWINVDGDYFGFGDQSLWVGTFPTHSATRAKNKDSKIEVPWVDVTADDPANPGKKIVVSRYAFWVEDESFRINLNTSATSERGGKTLGTGPKEIPLQGITTVTTDASTPNKDAFATGIDKVRGYFKDNETPPNYFLPSNTSLNRAIESSPELYNDLGFLTTTTSTGLNQSRSGARRLNINAIFGPASASTPDQQLDQLISAIDQQAPDFGQRFYRIGDINAPGVTTGNPTDHDRIYLEKLAANIRDYIDADHQPTVVMSDRTVYSAGKPTRAIRPVGNSTLGSGANSVMAIGKEAVPHLQQTMFRVKQYDLQSGANSPYRLRLSYYFEFWNTSTKDISAADLGPDAFLKIANQPGWRISETKAPIPALREDPSRDIEIPLTSFKDNYGAGSDLVFKAGEVTVLTNDPDPGSLVGTSSSNFIKNTTQAKSIFCAPSFEEAPTGGTVPRCTRPDYGGYPTLEMQSRDQLATSPTGLNGTKGYDLRTEVFLGTSKGWLESHHEAIPMYPSIFVDAFPQKSNTTLLHMRGGTLQGNVLFNGASGSAGSAAPAGFGDPTANNEQLTFRANNASDKLRTGFVSWRNPGTQSSADSSQQNSLTLQNTQYVNPSATGAYAWPEVSTPSHAFDTLANGGGLYTIKDGPMDSIGELGFIYDPRRQVTSGFNIENSFGGGGLTLNVGTSDAVGTYAVWDGAPLSASRNWAAWRLTDILSTTDTLQIPGLVNVNGVLRDDGAALRAMLSGLTFSSDLTLTDSGIKDASLSQGEIDKLVTSLQTRIAGATPDDRGMPLMERGEISELGYFSTADPSQSGSPGGRPLLQLNNRGREELFRRIVEMITPRGNTFSVYTVGQAMRTNADGTVTPSATIARKITFRLKPVYATPDATLDTFVPATDAPARFAKPTRYDIEILAKTN